MNLSGKLVGVPFGAAPHIGRALQGETVFAASRYGAPVKNGSASNVSPVAAAVGLTLLVGLGAVAGRAMTPAGKSSTAYTVAGGALGLLGPLGLGVLGVISLAQRK